MTELSGATVAVVGAGVFGLAIGAQLARRGALVTLHHRGAILDTASSVAAGMLAPALEAALDPRSSGHFSLLRSARDMWPAFLETVELRIAADRAGALFIGEAAEREALLQTLQGLAAQAERVGAQDLARLQPRLSPGIGEAVFTPEDWRIEPRALLQELLPGFLAAGGTTAEGRISPGPTGGLVDEAGKALRADRIVLAPGAEALALRSVAPELAVLQPVKGQILQLQGGPSAGAVIRMRGGYLAPQPDGLLSGATMEFGATDRRIDAAALGRLRDQAARAMPSLADAPGQGFAGVRALTPDGLPLVGASASGLLLAVGAGRNGWLLAPLVAEVIAAILAGRDAGPQAAALNPARFIRQPTRSGLVPDAWTDGSSTR